MSATVTIHSSGESFPVEPQQTILEAALKHGHNLPYGCRDGVCGACRGRLIDGDIRYSNAITGLSEQDTEAGYILLCQAIPLTDLVIETQQSDATANIILRRLACRVTKIERFDNRVIRLFLQLPAGDGLQFLPGQYINLLLPNGKRRAFSLANAPHDNKYLELHIRYYQGGLFSDYAFKELQENTLLRFEGPLGSFFLREDSERPIIMVAGGTGFAPIKSIIEHSLHSNYCRPIRLYWGARTEKDIYLSQLAYSWAAEYDHIRYIPVLSDIEDSDTSWPGRRGLVHTAVIEDIKNISNYDVYTCGPPPMVNIVRDSLVEKGLSPRGIYSDSFECSTA